jgi:sodium/potassium-transporting ATPase subunit alpha
VPGDIVEIGTGDNIPADVVLIKTNEMKVNNASLTGESEDLLRKPEEKSTNIFESPNVAFFGTTPIAREIDRFSKIIASIAITSGIICFCVSFIYGYPVLTNVVFMIGIIVANVPEGLLITVTVCMALSA